MIEEGSTIRLSLVKLLFERLRLSRHLRNERVDGRVVRSLDSKFRFQSQGRCSKVKRFEDGTRLKLRSKVSRN